MKIRIRDWDKHFERDRTRQWKRLEWFPLPNKQGLGYRKIMQQANGVEIYGCWVAILGIASKCSPRGDLSRYSVEDLSVLTLIEANKLKQAIAFLSQHLDWIEVVEESVNNLDTNVNNIDTDVNKIDIKVNNVDLDVCDSAVNGYNIINNNSDSIINNINTSNNTSNNTSTDNSTDNVVLINKKTIANTDKKQVQTWRTSYAKYIELHDLAYQEIVQDQDWIKKLKELNPTLNVNLSLKNAREFWRSEEGWKHKKKDRINDINWRATYRNAVRMPMNRVFEQNIFSSMFGPKKVTNEEIEMEVFSLKGKLNA